MANALTAKRAVRSFNGNKPGPIWHITRSIGMGGPASMLLWSIGYDPIVEAIGGPTFVDDLAALTCGPTATLRAQFFLLAAGSAAGLRIAAGTCAFIEARGIRPEVQRALQALPAKWSQEDGWTSIRGPPPHIVERVARHATGGEWADVVHIRHTRCQCSVKSEVVPQQQHRVWREAMG